MVNGDTKARRVEEGQLARYNQVQGHAQKKKQDEKETENKRKREKKKKKEAHEKKILRLE